MHTLTPAWSCLPKPVRVFQRRSSLGRWRPGPALAAHVVAVTRLRIRPVAPTRLGQQSYLWPACKCYDDVQTAPGLPVCPYIQSQGVRWHRATGVRRRGDVETRYPSPEAWMCSLFSCLLRSAEIMAVVLRASHDGMISKSTRWLVYRV